MTDSQPYGEGLTKDQATCRRMTYNSLVNVGLTAYIAGHDATGYAHQIRDHLRNLSGTMLGLDGLWPGASEEIRHFCAWLWLDLQREDYLLSLIRYNRTSKRQMVKALHSVLGALADHAGKDDPSVSIEPKDLVGEDV